ncbi:hypothetical protein Cantr_06594 [Candida viswanathii]|uniref:Uncharacterized protein n=1 Tax=Candida viswanathii TaxID=5486 RepID=A0A367XWS0_9ASCO|nr:hypothetical protein Cantr_06594 [Candida viswanathii]
MSYQYPTKFVPVSTNLHLCVNDTARQQKHGRMTPTSLPIYKLFNSIEFHNDPLADILNLLRQTIGSYTLKYPREGDKNGEAEAECGDDQHTDDDKENSQATIPRITQSTPVKTHQQPVKAVKSRSKHKVDNLACHADNILRMAIDSTIISSNSFTINSFDEDDEDDDHLDVHEHSLIELLKSKSSFRDLRRKRSTLRFDINADDINSVL